MAARAESPTSAAAEAWQLLQQVMSGQKGRVMAIASEFELAPMQVLALHALEQPRAMSELAAHLHCDNSNVTGIVDRLEDRGLVERRPSPHDRRVKMLELTEAGAAVRARLHARMSEPPEPLTRLSEDDARALRDVLRRALGR